MANLKEYYLGQNYNCAESILRSANDRLNLGLDEKALKMVAGCGGGFGSGGTCGTLCASIAVLSLLFVDKKAHETEGLREKCIEFYHRFESQWGSVDCRVIKAMNNRDDGSRCFITVEACEALLDELVAKHKADIILNTDKEKKE